MVSTELGVGIKVSELYTEVKCSVGVKVGNEGSWGTNDEVWEKGVMVSTELGVGFKVSE